MAFRLDSKMKRNITKASLLVTAIILSGVLRFFGFNITMNTPIVYNFPVGWLVAAATGYGFYWMNTRQV